MAVSNSQIQLTGIVYTGPTRRSEFSFSSGVNVICGASDTGKSFLAESVDFMLGGSQLRDIPERTPYNDIQLDFEVNGAEKWRLCRATSGGNFRAQHLNEDGQGESVLKRQHAHGKTDNVSGFLLDRVGLNGRRILRSKANGTTQSLSFRNLARLVLVQEGEIQQRGSPFWGGQYTLKTAELATIKLLLTGVDDSGVVATENGAPETIRQIELIDELIGELRGELSESGEDRDDLEERINRLSVAIEARKESLNAAQGELNRLLAERREMVEYLRATQGRIDEIDDLGVRFELLLRHYRVDEERLTAIQESGSMFAHVETERCPLCGAAADDQKHDEACQGDVEAIVESAAGEVAKIARLRGELRATVGELEREAVSHKESLASKKEEFERIDAEIRQRVAPHVAEDRGTFAELIEERAQIQKVVELFVRVESLEKRRGELERAGEGDGEGGPIVAGLPEAVAHEFSLKVSSLLMEWDFPGECRVHFDKETTDVGIDGKHRADRGKGLRAITHAAVTMSLLEYCQEHDLPHPGFIVLDSPLLAYFRPEGDDDMELQGTELKERFYKYLSAHHVRESQVIIIENQHPPMSVRDGLTMTVFTGNPNEGRQGFL